MEILHRRRVAALVAAMVALVAVSVSGQSSTNSCANNLVPCQPYLSSDKPPSSCCDPLKKTVQDDLPCLCALFNNTEIFKAYNINITQALLLPLHCGINNNVSACNASSPGASYTPPANPGGNGKNAAYRASWIGIPGPGGKLLLSGFTVSWLDDKDTFQAGDRGTIMVKPFDNSFNDKNFSYSSYAVNFSLSVSGKKGNSSYISGVFPYFEGDPTSWNISFTPIRVGEFIVVITEDHSGITDLSLHFTVTPGHMYASACMVSWMNLVNVFVAGTKAYFLVLPKDAFGNNISSNISKDYFKVAASYENGSFINMLDVRDTGWNEFGYIGIEFLPITAGSFLLHVYADNQTLSGSPLAFMVKPGSLDITSSVAKWKYETNSLQIFSKLEIFIYQQDQFGNLIPGFHPFDARVVEKATSLTVPVADLFFQEVAQGIQLLSFIVPEPGEFMLTIFSTKNKESISSMPYHYTVFIGYCHGVNSVVNGSGLGHSIAGRMSYFTVYLKDLYLNPSLVETIRLRVHILGKDADFGVLPVIFPLRGNETEPAAGQINFANGSFSPFPALSVTENITLTGKSAVVASDFNISYTPEKSGVYEIWVFCGNIPLNDGHSYRMEVAPGTVDTSLSSVLNFVPSVQRLIKNEVSVQLLDALFNPITSHKSRLSFQIEPANSLSFLTWAFEDNGNGSYVGSYLAKDLGSYKLCILVEDQHLSPCPFEVHVYEREYFPVAYNDNISVWEDESVAFDVLSNDYILGGPASIEVSTPLHGSLLQSGRLFIYTPYNGYFGMDTFSYTISDVNKNSAVGTVFISVLCKPPQFVSLPLQLHVTEDIVSPKFGGFSGFEILYSDVTENISITIRAQFGIVLFAPMPMQLYQPFESTLSVSRGGRAGKDLILAGHLEAINSALKFIQYIGNDNFYGHDILNLYAANKNGIQDAQVPMFVEPINDAPIIHSPKFIVLGMQEGSELLQIFDKQRDIFEFSILDPDIFNFPGNKSHFLVTFSMEVNDGTLSISLPVNLINSAELKTSSSNQWQPLQTFVTISSHFLLKGKGVRFRGTIGDCNNAMQRIFYQGPSHGAILSITVNDMGNYGCYSDCPNMMSLPQLTEATVSIIRKRPVSSVTSLLLGSAIIIEIVMMLILNGLLLFFICKCMNALHREKRDSVSNVNLHREESIRNQKMNTSELSRNVAYIDGHSRHFSLGRQQYKFQQRSCGRSDNKLTIKNGLPSSQSSGDNHHPFPLSVEMKTEEIH